MLESATVTMPYKELKELMDINKDYKEKLKKYKDIETMKDEEFEADPFKKGLDKICDLAEKASKYKKVAEKQYFIYQIMIEYCRVFEIPEKEIMEDIPEGTEPKK